MLNVLDFIFLTLAFTVTVTGSIINNFEKHVPTFVIKGYRYGSFAYNGPSASYLQIIEIPKSYYRHFYVFSALFSLCALILMILVYLGLISVPSVVTVVLRNILMEEHSSVCAAAALVAMTLLTIQCIRRLYETYYLQVFAKSSKMNINHYMAGIIHYFGCIITTIGHAPLFTGKENAEINWLDSYTNVLAVPCIIVFLRIWYEQYKTNVIFANMRKDKKSGKLLNEDHGIPYGRLFELISSPHRLCEIIMYTILVILIPTKTFFCIYLWVLGNQFQTAVQAHEWYKATFKTYPKDRTALIPHAI